MRLVIQSDYQMMSRWSACYIARQIRTFAPTASRPFVLGLPTGSSPLGTYRELIKLHQQGYLSFENVITFNLDEYVGLDKEHPESYNFYMWKNFFSHIDIKPHNVHIPDGNAADLDRECREYEEKIAATGGIHLCLCGIGSDGHLAFNEPFSSFKSRTRVKTLTYSTRSANSRFFDNDLSKVPTKALTIGIETVMEAEEIMLVISGYPKAQALQALVEGPVSNTWTATIVQLHKHALIVCDEAAIDELKVASYRYFKEVEASNLDPEKLLID